MIRKVNGTADEASLITRQTSSGGYRLIGRQRELDDLHRVVTVGMDQLSQLVEVAGDPGIGTTRLLDALCGMAARHGRVVLSGRATAFVRDVPFAVVMDALMDALPSLGVSMSRNVVGTDLALLRKGFPGLAGGMANSPAAGIERQQLYRAVCALLEVVGWGAGLVLVLDDTHWADAGSVEFVDFLVRHPPSIPFALVVGYRPRQISTLLSRALAQLTSMFRTRLDLRPLTLSQVGETLGADIGPTWQRRLHEASGGNPLYLEFLKRSGEGVPPGARWDPECVFDMQANATLPGAISGEFMALGTRAQLVARAAAVAGHLFEPELVAEVAAVSQSEAMAGLDELVAHDLVRSAGTNRRFRYRHALVRAAAYQLGGADWRFDAHARAAHGLEKRGAPAAARAHHVARCARVGDTDAIALLVRAAESTRATAPERTAHWLGVAIGLRPNGASSSSSSAERLVELMSARADALGASGQLVDSRDLLREVLPMLDGQPGERRGDATIACAAMERLLGHHDAAESLLTAELSRLSDHDGRLKKRIWAELALANADRGQFGDARAWAGLAASLPAHDDVPGGTVEPNEATMFAVHAIADAQTGQAESARRHLRYAAALLDALPDERAAGHLSLVLEVSRAELALELDHDALRHAARGLALSARTGRGHLLIELLSVLASAQTWLGRFADAAGTAQDMAETAARSGREEHRPVILACQAEIALWRGDAMAGLRLARQATAHTGVADYWWHGFPQAMYGWAQLANGDAAGCVREIVTAGGPGLAAYRVTLRPLLCDLLVQADTIAGDYGAARRWADQAREAASMAGLPGVGGHALLAETRALLAAGEPPQAVTQARRAAQAFASVHWRGHEGQARHLLGTALASVGRYDEAQQEWGRAKELFSACGARRMRVDVLNDQRRLAALMPRRARSADTAASGAGGLTSRELEIAGLVSAGCTNRQIAKRLFLSTKTIETHLTHIFAKLGVTSRSAVAAAFAQNAAN